MVKEFARAKINLTLDILGKRADGYHEVEMIMQTLELADIVEIEMADEIILKISGNDSLPNDEKNLAFRAVLEVQKFCNKNFGVEINLVKKIPSAAGLAGGSSDAAAVIRGLNILYDLNLSVAEMLEIGAKIGSDVPFCIIGGTCLASGRGEKLTRLNDLDIFDVVLIKPRGEISTAWAYQTYDEKPAAIHPPNAEIVKLLAEKNYSAAFQKFSNVLEPVAIKKIPAIETYKKFLIDSGAKVAMMSGSGPTVFAFIDNFDAEKFSGDAQIFITKIFQKVI
ncbi:MAG: 4-(cytidine 5'-diphospho)-2-C-methyl-D-erythritol kinase [Selenomonadaceae bacterium]|nr:4-(cytidine 5'-diphospho)-2-C-methyl-D-erythritol kinase [Selenomonadaceae bacterium]